MRHTTSLNVDMVEVLLGSKLRVKTIAWEKDYEKELEARLGVGKNVTL